MDNEQLEELNRVIGEIENGWCTIEKATAMAELILETKPQLVVEIGVFGGKSLIPQAMALDWLGGDGIIYGIDPWNIQEGAADYVDSSNREWWGALDMNRIHTYAYEQVWNRNLQSKAVLIRSPSYICYGIFNNIDILHIDGNHADPSARRDVKLYAPRVRPGGYIWFDDTDWAETQNAVRIMDDYGDLVKSVGTCNLYRRKAVGVEHKPKRVLKPKEPEPEPA